MAVKQKKLVAALGETLGCPTMIAVQEVENERLLHSLVDETAAICGFTYDISHRDSSDSRGLDLALLTDPNQVEIITVALRQTCTAIDTGIIDPDQQCPSSESPLFGRPPLQVDLQIAGTPYTVYVNHFKSKRGGEEETAPRRLQQADHIAQLVDDQLAADPQARIIVLGDFNDYERSPTMLQMTGKGNLINAFQQLPAPGRYSYIFDGVPQLIDGILVSPAVIPDIVDTMIIHANADYPTGLASDSSQQGLPLRSSDHDPLLLLLYLPNAEIPNYRSEYTPTQVPMPSPTVEPLETDRSSVEPAFALIWFFALIGLVGVMILLLAIRRKGR
jgi:predicted extracellular nuclease